MNDLAFTRALLKRPEDDAQRLVYADWLEEHDDPRAPYIRAHREIYQFIAELKTARQMQGPYARLDSFAASGRPGLLVGLALALDVHRQDAKFNPEMPWVVGAALERVERLLALTSDRENAEVFLHRACAQSTSPVQLRSSASVLAAGQDTGILFDLLGRHVEDDTTLEFLACLAQEMVLRGGSLAGHPAAERLAERMREADHPLAALPLHLTPVEVEVAQWLHQYPRPGSSSHATAVHSTPSAPVPPTGECCLPVVLSDVTDPTAAARISAAVANWSAESGGQVEACVFRPDRRLDASELSATLLLSAGLESLDGAAEADVRVQRIRPQDAFNFLFSAASGGGAYSQALYGAYGRLAAWQSLAGLTRSPQGQGVEEVAALVQQCAWASFETDGGWFYQIAWDLGLVALLPDGMSLTVLAATDTD